MSNYESLMKSNDIPLLINKICKEMQMKNDKTLFIKEQICLNLSKKQSVVETMMNINHLFNKKQNNELNTNPNHDYVTDNLMSIIKKCVKYHAFINIVDIGGGDGTILHSLCEKLNLKKENMFCVESKDGWSEEYIQKYSSIQYLVWDNIHLPFDLNSIDIFILMVSLHHMNEETILNVFDNLSKKIKKNGIVILKEHDCNTEHDHNLIHWEHHLYHLLNTPQEKRNQKDLIEYENTFVSNFKSKMYFDELFHRNGFDTIVELDRSFRDKKIYRNDVKNITKLYWKIYRKL
jgi:ubiquinone/menaquinone biosynthesis C-methylase UbiE